MEGTNVVGQVTWSLWDRMLEIYYRGVATRYSTLQVLDSAGNAYDVNDTSEHDARTHTIGVAADYTDDRLDPRRGVRFEMAGRVPTIDDPLRSSYYTLDYNLTGYIPMQRWDTLVLNLFASDAHVTGAATTDYAELQKSMGLGCDRLEPGPEQGQCLATEAKTINERIAENRYGTASSLGGTQRLRSFSNNRFKAGHAIFYGAEYRWNLTDERVPFDIIIARGVRTSLQVALFAEQGAVYDGSFGDWSDLQTSYGAGFRVALSGTILRADYATGSEGSQFQLFINYPWSMFAVDNPE
jgi:outer membrane protein assembly factor BamA